MTRQLHHFVPRFYLRSFIDPTVPERELIWVYERGKETGDLRPLDRVAAITNYYTVEKADGEKVQEAEKVIAEFEGKAAPICQGLLDGKWDLTDEQRAILSIFIGLMWARVPKFRTEIENVAAEMVERYSRQIANDAERFQKTVKEAESSLGHELGDAEELRKAILNDDIQVKTRPEYSLGMTFSMLNPLATMISEMKWTLREAPDDFSFVTSDSPVILNNPTMLPGEGPPTPTALEVLFPISRRLIFVATWDGHAGKGKMHPVLARTMNKAVALAADKYVYSPERIPALPKFLVQDRKPLMADFLRDQMFAKMEERARRAGNK